MIRPLGAILVNSDFYNRMPKDLQQVINDATGVKPRKNITLCFLGIGEMAKKHAT